MVTKDDQAMAWRFERVAGPYQGPTGGVAWDGEAMLFSVPNEGRIMRFNATTGAIGEYRRYMNRVNGLGFGADGDFYGCQEGSRRIVQFHPDGSTTTTATWLDGKIHNYPSDLVVDKAGRVWFSDPCNATPAIGIYRPPLDHASVLRLERDQGAWRLVLVTRDTNAPRAVLLSADETILYVSEGDSRGERNCALRSYPVNADGSVGPYEELHAFGIDHRGAHRGIEGMCLDSGHNIVACAGSRQSGPGPLVYVFSPGGVVLEAHPLPFDMPMRCAFGDADLCSLYVTSGDGGVYRAKTERKGLLKRQ